MFNKPVRFKGSLPVLAVSVVLLSGCGVASTQFHPGVAAQVGDTTITTRQVDKVTEGYCSAIESVTADQGGEQQTLPMRTLSRQFTTALVIEAAAKELADDYDVEPGESYRAGLAQLQPQIASLSDDEKDAVLEAEGAQAYYQDVLTQIGGIELEKAGTTDATDEDKSAEGEKVLTTWLADHDVDVNPKYGFVLDDTDANTDISFAVSSAAKEGLKVEPDPSYTSDLPGNLVCGD